MEVYVKIVEAFVLSAIGMAVIVNRGIEFAKPMFMAFEALLVKIPRLDSVYAARIVKATYVLAAVLMGYIVAQNQGINPFVICVGACQTWFSEIPAWAIYLVFGALVSIGAETLHQIIGFIKSVREWLSILRPPGSVG